MKVRAPGKLLLSGAYAVLEGAPAIVLAVDRYAIADSTLTEPSPALEVRAALGAATAPRVDARALFDERGHKLGLGSSAAVLVASLGAVWAARGADLDAKDVRERLFGEAREAHARAQLGGSGVDVAASVFGGVLRYEIREGGLRGEARPLRLPPELVVVAFWTGTSARTSELRARVDALRARDRAAYDARVKRIGDASRRAERALEQGEPGAFIAAAAETNEGLAALGRDSDASICTAGMLRLSALASSEGAAFLPSGAGGGDIAVFVGMSAPSEAFSSRARAEGMSTVGLGVDPSGVCCEDRVRTEH